MLQNIISQSQLMRKAERGHMNERTKNIDVALIYALWDEYGAALHAGDLERWLSIWMDDAIRMPPGSPPQVGKEQIRAAMQAPVDLFTYSNMTGDTAEVRVLGDTAYSYGTYTFDMTPKEGGETISYSGKFLDIVVKQADGSWKIAVDCHNFNEPYA